MMHPRRGAILAALALMHGAADLHAEPEAPETEGERDSATPAENPSSDDAPEGADQQLEELSTRIHELEAIVEDLERKSAVQRVAWSADYRVTLSSFRYSGDSPDESREADGSPTQVELNNREQWTHRARLSLQADPTSKLRFRARLVTFKRFGETSFGTVSDGQQGRVPRDTTARFDRFWLDWFVANSLSFSFGRLSTTDGSPAELRENLDQPASTISLGLVDTEYDVVAATVQKGGAVFRAFYLAWQFQREDDVLNQFPFLARDQQPVRVFGATASYRSERPGLPSFEASTFAVPGFRGVPPLSLPQSNGTLLTPSRNPTSLGRLGAASALLLWRDLVKGLDVFASGNISYAKSNGKAIEFPIGPEGQSVPVLTLVTADAKTHIGYQAYAGFRLTPSLGGAHAPKLGFEFAYGSRYAISFSSPTTDLISRLGVRGKTYDAYVIQPIYPNLFARLSFTLIDHDYRAPLGGGLGFVPAFGGTSAPVDRTISGINLMLNAAF
jgi:Protein of unknown function (DUF3373)